MAFLITQVFRIIIWITSITSPVAGGGMFSADEELKIIFISRFKKDYPGNKGEGGRRNSFKWACVSGFRAPNRQREVRSQHKAPANRAFPSAFQLQNGLINNQFVNLRSGWILYPNKIHPCLQAINGKAGHRPLLPPATQHLPIPVPDLNEHGGFCSC